jgi:uroporphyrin-3 C-methyltransferase
MNEAETPETLPALTAPPRRPLTAYLRRLAPWLGALALLGVVLLAVLAWQSRARVESTRQELSRRLAASEAAHRDAGIGARQNREALDALQAKVGALDARLAEMQSQQLALETMYQEFSRVRDDRLLAEVEQEIALAAQQLQLAGNVEAALIALRGAEARLAKSAQPQFLPLRKLIVRDIERLRALPAADVPGIAFRLDALLDLVPNLPLAYEQRPAQDKSPGQVPARGKTPAAADAVPPAPTSDWQGMAQAWLGELWREMRQLVRIERIERPDPGLLAPRENYFLRENLRLRLLAARLALLARDGRSFQADLKQADVWLERYFDLQSPPVQEARAVLKELIRLDVVRTPADLNETLAALRNFKLARERGPAR